MLVEDNCLTTKKHNMKIYPQLNYQRILLLFALIIALTLAACGSTTSTKPAQKVTTPGPTQPISSQQLLTGSVTYVALGASDAVGVGTDQPATQGYVPLLAQKLPGGSHLINLGVSGIHLHEALSEELPLALSTNPRLITIWLVANDFIANVPYNSYMQDLNTLLMRLRSGTHARIVMANLPDLTRLPLFSRLSKQQKASTLTTILHWNASIASTARRYNVDIVDLMAQASLLTSHPEYISGDGFHPSAAGYAQLANLFWQVIK
jgi:acyl-CoA thioesterase-1